MTVNYVNLQGLKCSAVYRDTETGKTYNGAALMEAGIPMPVEMGEFKEQKKMEKREKKNDSIFRKPVIR